MKMGQGRSVQRQREKTMNKKIEIGLIGLGGRGQGLLEQVFIHHPDVEIAAVCDVYEYRCEQAADFLEKQGRKRPETVTDYRKILEMPQINAVILCTSWDHHLDICMEAMAAGKYVGCEVGGAYSVTV